MKSTAPSLVLPLLALLGCFVSSIHAYWMADIMHQGYAPYAEEGYVVFRNIKDYGAVGDGVTDDTAAINAAIMDGNRCGKGCASSTTTPAVVYFPPGTYALSSSILPAYMTQLIGDPSNPATLKALAGFVGFGLIDGDPYYTPELNWLSTNVFFRQVRNLVLDTTAVAAATTAYGMHWPTAQATSLQNVLFRMPTTAGVQHIGLFVESGSGGFMGNVTFEGGAVGAALGNQQFTMRDLTFRDCVTAVNQLWDWGWTFSGLRVSGGQVGLNLSAGGSGAQTVGSMTLIDSEFSDVPVAVQSAWTAAAQPAAAGSLVLENVVTRRVPVVVQTPDGAVLPGSAAGDVTVAAWAQGHAYSSAGGGPATVQGSFAAAARPASLVCADGSDDADDADDALSNPYYARIKPQYAGLGLCHFVSARSGGAKGDGVADDTAALQATIDYAARAGKIVYIDYGVYRVTSTLTVPPGSRIVGEAYPVLLAAGTAFFANDADPRPLLRVGAFSGQPGSVELSDFVLGTQGPQAGAVLVQWNLDASAADQPAGMWDVHTRVGGFDGSDLQVAQCLKDPAGTAVRPACIAAFMSMHVTAGAAALYAENVWLWTADHDMDDGANTQITVYAGRGLYVDAAAGTLWLVGTAVEHHVLYQYQLDGTRDVFMGQVQTETPYYQPNPLASLPFEANATYSDPDFAADCQGVAGTCEMAWGLRLLASSGIRVYGAGLYSFFSNYTQTCIADGQSCQARIASLEGDVEATVIYNLNTIGAQSMLTQDGVSLASYADNVNVYPDTIALFQTT